MSIYTKPLSQIDTADLQELLTGRDIENVRLEFKSLVPDKDETLKKLSSFANTFGGFMVVGARANSDDGRIEDLPGVDEQAGYKQKVVAWCFNGASPPLTVEVSDPVPAPSGSGKVCYVIHTAESDVAPRFLNGRKGIWVRTDEFSARFEAQLANDNELRELFDRRKLIRERRIGLLERARKRFGTYVGKIQTNSSGNRTNLGPYLEFFVVPRFPARPLFEETRLKPIITDNYIRFGQLAFPRISGAVVSQHESAIVLQATLACLIFEASIWGSLFYGVKLAEDYSGTFGIHLNWFVGYTLVFIRHAAKMLQALGYAGPIHADVKLASMRGAKWMYGPSEHSTYRGSELDDVIEFSIASTTDALQQKPDGVAMEILRYVFFSVNCPDLVDPPQNLENLVRDGYLANSWVLPDALLV